MDLKSFKTYIKQRLGYPVINIEVSEEQIQNAIDDTIQLYYENHYDGMNIGYVPLNVTKDTKEYKMDDSVLEVIQILGRDDFVYSGDPMITKESLRWDYSYDSGNVVDLISLEVWRQNLQNIRHYYTREVLFDFNTTTHTLYLPKYPEQDFFYIVKVYASDADIEDIYNDRWIKNYAVALTKKQWATNLQKYNGAQMVGGAEFNHQGIMQQAEDEIKTLLIDLEEKYSEPLDFEIG